MQCPTCASPLPVGAMICGECGRTLSGVDTSGPAGPPVADPADSRPPAWRLQSPARPAATDRPWWVHDTTADALDEAPSVSDDLAPSASDPVPVWRDGSPEASADREAEHAAASAAAAAEDAAAATASEESRQAGGPSAVGGGAAPVTPRPAPLREPSPRGDDASRPPTAPLWTASLTPVSSRTDVPVVDGGGTGGAVASSPGESSDADSATSDPADAPEIEATEIGGAAPESAPVSADAGRSGTTGDVADVASDDAPSEAHPTGMTAADAADDTPAAADPADDRSVDAGSPVASAPGLGSTGAHSTDDRPVTDDVVPRPGDTVRVEPIADSTLSPRDSGAAPVPLVEPGTASAAERCTECGAEIHEDDIFCGVCGAVVASVALSFTGPIVPLSRRSPLDGDDRPAEVVVAPEMRSALVDGPSRADQPEQRSEPQQRFEPEQQQSEPETDHARPSTQHLPPVPEPAWGPRRPAAPTAADDEDVDETRLVRRGPTGSPFVLQFSTGESFTVDGSGLVGRAPTPQPGESFDQLVRIVDPGRSVSKTHLEFGQDDGHLWLSDRWSGNGTIVRPHGEPARRLEPGTRVRVSRGSRVDIGEQFFVVG